MLAPAVAPALGFAPEQVGSFVGVVYLFAMLSGLLGSGFVSSLGALRFCQFSVGFAALGLAFLAMSTAAFLLLGALAIGVAYGLANPSAAQMLGQHAAPSSRALIFSIKQTGVPIGVALAGLVAPWLYLLMGWRQALFVLLAFFVIVAILLQPLRAVFDRQLERTDKGRRLSVMGPLSIVFGDQALRRLALTSLIYAITQICLLTFLVSYLHLEHRISIVGAAAVLSSAQLASIIGRPFWGIVADRFIAPAPLLGGLGVLMGLSCLALAMLPSEPALWSVYAASLACAATAIAWNGVFYAELVRISPTNQLATITGGTQFMTFLGGVLGPTVFAQVVLMADSYAVAFGILAALPFAAGVNLLIVRSSRVARSTDLT